jgi:hypothetical protein
MKRSEFCGPREPVKDRLARLGLRQEPDPSWKRDPSRFYLTRRRRRELDEITLSKPYIPENDKT